jgi:hypothetical protein
VARAQPSAGQLELTLRTRPSQAARQVWLQVNSSAVLALRAPQRPGASTGKGGVSGRQRRTGVGAGR